MSRSRRKQLEAIPEDLLAANQTLLEGPVGPVQEMLQLVDGLEAAVEDKISSIVSAAEDAIMTLKNECKRQLMLLPTKTRKMPLADFQAAYPGDLQAGALEEIRGRYAAMAAAAAAVQPVPATGRTTRTATKRGGAEPQTVLRTVRARRGPVAPPPKFGEEAAGAAALEPGTAGWPGVRSQLPSPAAVAVATEEAERRSELVATARRGTVGPPAAGGGGVFMGMPLQTPMPFAGEALAVPITLFTQKRGGGGGGRARTKAVAAPDAAVITTADGKQWALGAEGVQSIPDSHRQEVSDLLTAQFNFFAAALGKTVFQRGGGKARR